MDSVSQEMGKLGSVFRVLLNVTWACGSVTNQNKWMLKELDEVKRAKTTNMTVMVNIWENTCWYNLDFNQTGELAAIQVE